MEDEESFVPCNPAPVNNRLLKELETRGPRATEARHLALTYGVLAAYAEYTEGLLEDVSNLPPHVVKKITTVFEMLQSVIQLFTDVVSTITNTNNIKVVLKLTPVNLHITTPTYPVFNLHRSVPSAAQTTSTFGTTSTTTTRSAQPSLTHSSLQPTW